MELVRVAPRPNWQDIVQMQGMDYHSIFDEPYWVEDHAYRFESHEVLAIEEATAELQRICLETVEDIIRNDQFDRLAIPEKFIPLIIDSWDDDDPTLYGRFDLVCDGDKPPRMMEYNADTPTALLESAIVQWYWLEDQKKSLGGDLDQFNSIHEEMISAWEWYRSTVLRHADELIYFSCMDAVEDRQNVEYMRDCAVQAGLSTAFIDIGDIGCDGTQFMDLEHRPIRHLFKLYPWEMLVREPFGDMLINRSVQLLEPAWKMILSNKAMLPLVWERFEGHPNLLPTYFSPEPLGNTYVKKPIFSREGANITIVTEESTVSTEGVYGAEGYIYQAFARLPKFDTYHAMVGSWVVGSIPCGMCVRESEELVTSNTSHFVPHYFTAS